jgi:hypothetical protein
MTTVATAEKAPKAPKAIRIPKAHSVSVAAKVRYLNEKGLTRVQIAKQLGIRYQRVRNVLVPRVKAQVEETAVEGTEPATEAGTEIEPGTDELDELEQVAS